MQQQSLHPCSRFQPISSQGKRTEAASRTAMSHCEWQRRSVDALLSAIGRLIAFTDEYVCGGVRQYGRAVDTPRHWIRGNPVAVATHRVSVETTERSTLLRTTARLERPPTWTRVWGLRREVTAWLLRKRARACFRTIWSHLWGTFYVSYRSRLSGLLKYVCILFVLVCS